ncbi:MAG TPA: hypothetical protein VJQ54_24925 [Candidatus Sulfotelmatobacter sp.]|nr:hypothetical protein [Candidatus Sulfotelmatobacter sp.]
MSSAFAKAAIAGLLVAADAVLSSATPASTTRRIFGVDRARVRSYIRDGVLLRSNMTARLRL